MAEAAFGYGDPMSTITESRERSVVEAVPKRLLVAGEWRDAEGNQWSFGSYAGAGDDAVQ